MISQTCALDAPDRHSAQNDSKYDPAGVALEVKPDSFITALTVIEGDIFLWSEKLLLAVRLNILSPRWQKAFSRQASGRVCGNNSNERANHTVLPINANWPACGGEFLKVKTL